MFDQSLLATWFDLSWMFPPATILSERLGWVLLHTTWQFSLFAAMAGIVARAIQGRSANVRYVLLLVALILMAFTPLITWSVIPSASASAAPTMDAIGVGVSRETAALSPTIGEALAPPHSNRAAPADQQAQLANERVTASNRQMPLVTLPESPTRSAGPDWKTTLVDWFRPWLTTVVWIWCIGAVGFSLRPLVGWKNVRRLRREGVVAAPRELDDLFRRTATTLGIVRSVDLLCSTLVRVPVVVGWLRPAVLLPVSIMGELPVSQIEGILAHELAHIRRHDYLINMFQTVLEAIFFYHPAVWWLSHHIRLERENCCDDWAVHATGDRLTYGRALLALEDLRATEPILALSAGKGPLVSRIHRVLQIAPVRTSSQMSGWSASGVVAIVAVCVGLCAGLPAKPTESKDESNTPAEATNPTREAWPMGGGSPNRVNSSPAKHLPAAWNTEKGENIAWQAPTGTISYGSPVVSAGKVLVGANNGGFHIQRYPPEHDLACLLCFDAETGEFLWQYSSEKLQTGRVHDWPMVGLCSTPCIVGDRVWLTSNRGEVVCLDINGFTDDENDGPLRDESSTAKDEADVIWKFDMMGELGVSPLYQSCSSPVIADDLVLVCTSNGVEEGLKEESAAPDAPAFIALNRHTGKLIWQDNSPGVNNLGTQCPSNSPTVATIAGRQQAIFPGSDGWLYAFDVAAMQRGATELLWKFDVNEKRAIYRYRGVSQRNVPMSAPVFYENKVYVTTGRNPEHGDGDATLWCIDPSKRGDLSQELVYNRANPEQPIPHKRLQACDESQGDFTKPNPNSGVVWQYRAFDLDNNGKVEFEETFHRTIGSAAIDNGLLFVADYAGIVHCLDATSGKLHWTHDALAQIWSTPVIADGKVYVCDEDGDVTVFRQSATKVLVVENVLDESVFSTPAAVDRTLFIGSRTKLFACRQDATRTPADMALDNPSTPVERENAPPRGDDEFNRVVDMQGRPVAGAKVEFTKSIRYPWLETPPPVGVVVTDAKGLFAYPDSLPSTESFYVYVSADGFLTRFWHGNRDVYRLIDGERRADTLVLFRPVKVSGRILDRKGRPLAGAEVAVDYFIEDGPANINGHRVTSDSDGRFSAEGLPPANLFIRYEGPYATADDRMPVGVQSASFLVEHRQGVDGQPLEDVLLDLRKCNCTVEGVIVDHEDKGVPGRWIRATLASAKGRLDESMRVKSDEDGKFRFTGIGPGEYVIGTETPGATQTVRAERGESKHVRVTTFQVGRESPEPERNAIAWGDPNANGLIAGLSVSPTKSSYAIGDVVSVEIVVRNPTSETRMYEISFAQQGELSVLNADGEPVAQLNYGHFTGLPYVAKFRLAPNHQAVVGTFQIGLTSKADSNNSPPKALFHVPVESASTLTLRGNLSANVFGGGATRNDSGYEKPFLTGLTDLKIVAASGDGEKDSETSKPKESGSPKVQPVPSGDRSAIPAEDRPMFATPREVLDHIAQCDRQQDFAGFVSVIGDDEALRLAGMMLQTVVSFESVSGLVEQLGAVDESFTSTLKEFRVILDRYRAKEPSPEATAAYQRMQAAAANSTFIQLFKKSPVAEQVWTPESYSRHLRTAAGILTDARKFLAEMLEVTKALEADEAESDGKEPRAANPTKWDIQVEGDQAVATSLPAAENDKQKKSQTVELRRENGRWYISSMITDEEILQAVQSARSDEASPAPNETPRPSP